MLELQSRPRALLFDLDGTLLDCVEWRAELEFIALSLLAYRRKTGSLRKAVRSIQAVTRALVKPGLRLDGQGDGLTNAQRAGQVFGEIAGLPSDQALEFLEAETARLFPRIERHFHPVPGAADFVRWAHGRFPLYLVTNPVWSEGPIQARVRWAGLEPELFRSLTHSRRSSASKPSEAYYREFLGQEGLRAEDCLMIGNDPINDLHAVRVGIPVCLVNPTRKTRDAALEIEGGRAPAYRATFKELREALAK